MNTNTSGNTIGKLLVATALALVACGPDPGTPDYVLSKLREGRVVGGKNLKLLTEDHLAEMQALLTDREAASIARLQVLERLFQLEPADAFERFGPLVDDDDPEIRLRVIQWLGGRSDTASAKLLIARIAKEQELVVRGNAIRALRRIGSGIAEPDPELIDTIVAKLEDPATEDRRSWASMLGGWHGERVEAALIKALDDSDAEVRQAAAKSLAGPLVRSLERVAPLYVSMLKHSQPEVRSAAIMGLGASTHPHRVPIKGSTCTEAQLLPLLEAVPELPEALAVLRRQTDLTTKDKRIVEDLVQCIAKFTGGDAGPIQAAQKGP